MSREPRDIDLGSRRIEPLDESTVAKGRLDGLGDPFDPGKPCIVSLSGGKDSSALLLMLRERKVPIHSAVYCDMGEWEFPELDAHLDRLQAMIAPARIVRVAPRNMLCMMLHQPRHRRDGTYKNRGMSWPGPRNRWCTREKRRVLNAYVKAHPGVSVAVGFAADEPRRMLWPGQVAPLRDWGVTEAQALEYCRGKGLDWGGLYDLWPRVSCFCCPLQSLDSLRRLRRHRPELWAAMLEWSEALCRVLPHACNFGARGEPLETVEARFAAEDATRPEALEVRP